MTPYREDLGLLSCLTSRLFLLPGETVSERIWNRRRPLCCITFCDASQWKPHPVSGGAPAAASGPTPRPEHACSRFALTASERPAVLPRSPCTQLSAVTDQGFAASPSQVKYHGDHGRPQDPTPQCHSCPFLPTGNYDLETDTWNSAYF